MGTVARNHLRAPPKEGPIARFKGIDCCHMRHHCILPQVSFSWVHFYFLPAVRRSTDREKMVVYARKGITNPQHGVTKSRVQRPTRRNVNNIVADTVCGDRRATVCRFEIRIT